MVFSPEWEKLAQKKGKTTLAERETGQRILWLLDYGLPENWKAQMEGNTFKLCYNDPYERRKRF